MWWQSGAIGLSTVLNAHGSDAFTPCKRTPESQSLKSDIAAGKGFGYWGAFSCAQLFSIKNKNKKWLKSEVWLKSEKNKNIETQQNFTGS